MILDSYLTFSQKIIIALISASIWIYFRDISNYKLLPRKSIIAIFIVCFWLYLNYYEPLVVPIGLLFMYIYSIVNKNKKNNL